MKRELMPAKTVQKKFIEAKRVRMETVQRLYSEGFSIPTIAKAMGVGNGTVEYMVKGFTKLTYNEKQQGDNGWKSRPHK